MRNRIRLCRWERYELFRSVISVQRAPILVFLLQHSAAVYCWQLPVGHAKGTHCSFNSATVVTRTRYNVTLYVHILPVVLLDRFNDSSANCTCCWVQEDEQRQKKESTVVVGEVLQISVLCDELECDWTVLLHLSEFRYNWRKVTAVSGDDF